MSVVWTFFAYDVCFYFGNFINWQQQHTTYVNEKCCPKRGMKRQKNPRIQRKLVLIIFVCLISFCCFHGCPVCVIFQLIVAMGVLCSCFSICNCVRVCVLVYVFVVDLWYGFCLEWFVYGLTDEFQQFLTLFKYSFNITFNVYM